MTPFQIPSDDLFLTPDIPAGQLPPFLEQAISITSQPEMRDMLLLSSLTACSYALPHLRMLHGAPQHTYYPNLMCLVVAPPAAGKGVMNNVRRLLAPIHKRLEMINRQATIPANCSSAAFTELLANNLGSAFMMETEMDVLSATWKNDYSNYSYLFRQAFEHETISRARKAPGGAGVNYIEVPNPRLSVLLSGTYNQLKPLIVSRENGLASRFISYVVEDVAPFDRQVFENGDHLLPNGVQAVYDQLAQDLLARWQHLSALDHDILWSLTDEQSAILGDLFEDAENLLFEGLKMPVSFAANFKRLAVSIKRIGVILTALRIHIPNSANETVWMNSRETVPPTLVGRGGERSEGLDELHHDYESLPSVLYCSDDDFHTLVTLAEKLLRHAARVALALPEEDNPLQATIRQRNTKSAELLDLLPGEFTTAQAVELAASLGITDRTAKARLAEAVENKSIRRVKKGYYRKN